MNSTLMVRAYTSATTYTYKWCRSLEEQEQVAAQYARAGFLKRVTSHRTRPYLRVTLVTYSADGSGSHVERDVYRRAGKWPSEYSQALTA